jgi:DUF4097 and DUF4098 domain-containing protein YvlB
MGNNGTRVTVNGVNVSGDIDGANSAAETVQKKFLAEKVSSLKEDVNAGSIEVRTLENGQDEIHVVATKTLHGSDSPEMLKTRLADVSVQADLLDGALVLSSKHPADFDKKRIGVVVDYVVTVPPRLALVLRTGSGAITVSGVKGGATVHSDYGSIDLADVGGVLDASTSSGAISIERANEATRITAKSSYGNIDLRNAAGDIVAETESGAVTVDGVARAASIKLHSGYGEVSVSHATGMVDASSSSGAVTVGSSQITAGLKMHSDYGNVEASDITGASPNLNVEMTTSSGSVTYHGEASDLTLQSDYGEVNGELGTALTLHSAVLRSSSGAVSLVLPSSASAKVDASTSSGSVELPTSTGGNSGSLTLGGGFAQVKLESDYGNVVLRTK